MAASECSRSYHRMKIDQFELFAAGIKETYYQNNPPFTAPVITLVNFKKLLAAYNDAYFNYANGGKSQKGDWMIAKHALMNGLDTIADDVNQVSAGDENIILEGGFKPTKTIRSKTNLPPTPKIEELDRGSKGVITASCFPLGDKIYYGCIVTEGEPLPAGISLENGQLLLPKGINTIIRIDENQARKKVFSNLTSLATYYVYFFSRNAAGVSAISEGKSILCV